MRRYRVKISAPVLVIEYVFNVDPLLQGSQNCRCDFEVVLGWNKPEGFSSQKDPIERLPFCAGLRYPVPLRTISPKK